MHHEQQHDSRLPHRLAVALVCATFPLLWVGGLVTTYDAGMAVPDWPTTYGYNLFLYPWQTWVFGPWDLFIEHGHRLLGATAGLLAIALAAALWRWERRAWVCWLGVAALAAVVGQGVLGGMRVVWDERQLAMVHGCFGPLFFCLTVSLAVVTSQRWMAGAAVRGVAAAARLRPLALITTVLAYVQLVFGAALRHLPVDAGPQAFRGAVVMHLLMAAVLLAHVAMLSGRALAGCRGAPALWRPATALGVLFLLQLVLGGGTWLVNYGWPAMLAGPAWAEGYVITRAGAAQALVTTAHMANGSLVLAVALMLSLRLLRHSGGAVAACGLTMSTWEVAL